MTTNIISYKLTFNDILCRKNEVFLQFFIFFTSKKIKEDLFPYCFSPLTFLWANFYKGKYILFNSTYNSAFCLYPISPDCEKKMFDPYSEYL